MRRVKSILIVVTCTLVGLSVFVYVVGLVAPCSNCEAERYDFEASERQLVKAIDNFREIFPNGKAQIEVDSSGFSYIYLYQYPNENQIAVFDVRYLTNEITRLQFISIGYSGDTVHPYKLINRDFISTQNKIEKEKFERKFLDKLGYRYKDKGNGNFLWFKNIH